MADTDFILLKPGLSLADEISGYRRDCLEAGSSMDGCGSLRRYEAPKDWLAFNHLLPEEERAESGQFVYLRQSDRRIVGMLQIRPVLNEYLRKYGGHIGYSIRPGERRKGYGTAMLKAALPLCRELGLKKLLVTCLAENEASRRVILANGGVYEQTVTDPQSGEVIERYWIDL